ncbi:MAG: DUF3764 family protein [Ignavibacteriae bacterium]|nr:DUF3764 family protein [Ignavibacteriota bacterium]
MITTIVSHKVKDFSEWKKVFDASGGLRSKFKMNVTALFQSVDDPNMVTMIGEAPSVEDINEFNSNPELKAAMESGGLIGTMEVKILNKVF